jgi:glycerophosphoryl diester phosphodiesterase
MDEASRRKAPAVSAHRGGGELAPGGTYQAYRQAVAAGAEYVEFDVRLTSDGELVSAHHARVGGQAVAALTYQGLCERAGFEVPRVQRVMRLLAGQVTGHLDLKDPRCAEQVVGLALEVLGTGRVVVTTGDAPLLARLKRRFPAAATGLTLGGDAPQAARFAAQWLRRPGLSRLDLVTRARAEWAVLHHRLARPRVLARCRQRGLKTMVWTVNGDRTLARWMASPAVDVVVTDRPLHALALRDRLSPAPGPEPGP